MARLAISLLGPLEVRLDGRAVTALAYDKVWALLAYLAVEADRPHRRDALIGLLWPDQPDQAARTNLRQALTQLRQAIGDHTAQPLFLLIARESIQFNRASDHDLDVTAFEALLNACDAHPHRHADTCTACARRRREAAALYRGSFLAEFILDGVAAFEEWALLKREALHQRALDGLAHLATYYERRGAYEDARRYAQRQLELDPWNEAAHRQLMRIFALTGQRSAALRQYGTCRRALAEGLGVEPEAETTTLYVRLQRGEAVAAERMRPPATNLPAHTPPTLFIGREVELMHIAQRLEHRDCRLLTLVGLGGIGKTRLALQAAQEQLTSFSDGVYFVPLARLSSAEFLVPAIADALAFVFHGSQDLKTQLMAYLREKHMLLVLDNFEHLLDGTDVLSEIVQCAAGVTLLVTSRERLNLRVEWIMDIAGMPVPRGADSEAVATSSAVQLFVQTARQVQAGFALSPETVPSVVQICQLVEGMPLGIELAAAWAWAQPCAEIAWELEHSLDHLATMMRDIPARHRSMRAVFDHSWDLLSTEEQRVLTALSVFRGGFGREAAEQVTGASLPLLSGLVDKSLLQRNTAGRYGLHELVRQYASAKLHEAEEVENMRNRHLQYFVALSETAEPLLRTAEQRRWLARLEQEHDNIRAALAWCIDSGDTPAGLRLSGALWRFWAMRQHVQEGRARLATLLKLAEQSTAVAERVRAQGLFAMGFLAARSGDWTAYHSLFEASVAGFRTVGDRWGLALALSALSEVAFDRADLPTMRILQQESQALFEEIGESWGRAYALVQQGFMIAAHGDPAANVLAAAGIRQLRALGDNWQVAALLRRLAEVSEFVGDRAWTIQLAEEGLALAQDFGDRAEIAQAIDRLGTVMRWHGDYQRAAALYDEAVVLFRELGIQTLLGRALHGRGMVAYHQGDDQVATALFHASLTLFLETQQPYSIGWCFEGLAGVAGRACMGQAGARRATRLLGANSVLNDRIDLWSPGPRTEWEAIVAQTRAQVDESTFAAAWAEGRALSLEQAVAEALGDEGLSY